MNKKIKYGVAAFLIFAGLFCFAYSMHLIPHKKYENADFQIKPLISSVDKDKDGIDDQSDIMMNVRAYIKKRPRYESKYYTTGYPDDNKGVCTDVVAFSLKGAGYDLQALVDEDVRLHPERYPIEVADKNIDFRRVRNLLVYFENHALQLSKDIYDYHEWQGGDIVIFNEHIGIVSDKRNRKGIPFLIHHAHPYQLFYEEDVLERYEILGHYRISE